MSQPPKDFDAVRERLNTLREARAKAAGEKNVGVEDPTNKGTVSAPSHPDGDSPAKLGLPSESRPNNTAPVPDGVTSETQPGGTGEHVPPVPGDQNAKDEAFTSPTTPLSKIAGEGLAATVANLRALRQKAASAPTPAPAQPAAAPAQPAAAAPVQPAPTTKAATDIPQLTDEFHIKLAAELLSCQEGVDFAHDFLTKRAGQKAAAALINEALTNQAEFVKLAAFQKRAFDQLVDDTTAATVALVQAGPQARDLFHKLASTHQPRIQELEATDPMMAEFYKAGAADAALMEQMAAEAGPGAAMPTLPGADPAGPSDDQITAVIEQLVAQGAIDPATAEQLLSAVMGEGGAAPAAPAEGGGEAPEKEDSTKEASLRSPFAESVAMAAQILA